MSQAIATIENAGVEVDHQAILKSLNLNPRDPHTQALLLVCERYGLDPLLKHMVLIQGSPYITRDGYLAVAHKSGVFDGMEVVEQGSDSTHFIAKVSVWRKDMGRPFTFIGRYPKSQRMAKDYGPEMAVKVAEVQALRRAFNVTGVGAADERWDEDAVAERAPEPEKPVAPVATRTRPPEGRRVVDTNPPDDFEQPPSTGTTRKRKPPTAAAPAAEPVIEDAEVVDDDPPMSGQQRTEIARRLESLIPADKPKVMEVWKKRQLPMFYLAPAHEKNVNPAFSAVHAAQALAILVSFGADESPFVDPDEAA